MATPRIPFEVAITDPKLLQPHWRTLSRPQQVILKAFNGLPLNPNKEGFRWSEMELWAMLQGSATYDELGFPTTVTPVPYNPKKYSKLVAILGRRSGKTDRVTATQIAYEATLGGHMNHVTEGQDVQILFVAQDIDMAASHLNFIYQALMSSPLLKKEVLKFNADSIELRSGLKIVPAPPTIKSSRGLAVPGWCGDEVGFWYTDAKAANPDYEVERAVEYATLQFPDAFCFITSTPYTKEGMLWEAHEAGTEGCRIKDTEDRLEFDGVLVVEAPTAAMENPRITRKKLQRLQRKDPEAFVRESLAQFVDSLSNFFKPELVKFATDTKVLERAPLTPKDTGGWTPLYIAAMDPAFRHDNFAFTIFHHDMEKGLVQDVFIEWVPEPGSPLNPSEVLTQIKLYLDRFGLSLIYSDQYQLESLQQLALNMGFTIIGVDFTGSSKSKIYGSFRMLVNQRRIRLLDNASLYSQLVAIEKKSTPQGNVQISAPPGKKDDAAAATALAVHQCLWLLPSKPPDPPKEQTDFEKCLAQIERNRRRAEGEHDDDDEDDDFASEF